MRRGRVSWGLGPLRLGPRILPNSALKWGGFGGIFGKLRQRGANTASAKEKAKERGRQARGKPALAKRVRAKKLDALQVREPDGDLALCGLWGVGTVDDVLANGQSEVTADGPRGGLGNWVGAAGQLTPRLDGALALDNAGNERCGGDEVNELAEEWLVLVLCVVLLSGSLVCNAQIHSNQLEALALDAGNDLADVAVLNAVRLDENECTFSHG